MSNKEEQRKLLIEMMHNDEELGLYTNGWLKCPKCGQHHYKAEYKPYCSEDCERNKDD